MNYHDNQWIMEQICRHYNYALTLYEKSQIVGVFCQGSQNYGLDIETSDIDTKCILTPTFRDIALAKKAISTTNILDNNEHLDAKDVRLYCQCFQKQNLNFLEILFTNYAIINPLYVVQWERLILERERIARMNPNRAVRSMKGVAMEKFHAMEHPYPSKLDILEKYLYDGKQTHHLLRIEEYLERYIAGEPYADCLIPKPSNIERLLNYKKQLIPVELAREEAKKSLSHVIEMADAFCEKVEEKENVEMRELLEDVTYNIMKIAVQQELGKIISSYNDDI